MAVERESKGVTFRTLSGMLMTMPVTRQVTTF